MTIDRAEMARSLDVRMASRVSERFGDEPLYDALPPNPPRQVTTRGLAQDECGRRGICHSSFDTDGYREEERQMDAMLKEATIA